MSQSIDNFSNATRFVWQSRLLQGRCHRDGADQGKLYQRSALPAERHIARPDQSSRLSAPAPEFVRAAFQPADELRRLSTPNSDRDRSGGDREVEERRAQSDNVLDVARGNADHVFGGG